MYFSTSGPPKAVTTMRPFLGAGMKILSVCSLESAENDVLERGYKGGRISHSGHHFKLLDAALAGLFARFDIDLMQGLDVFGDERDGHDQKIFFSRGGQLINGVGQRR